MLNVVVLNDSINTESNLNKLNSLFENLYIINIDNDLNVFEIKEFLGDKDSFVIDFVNSSKSRSLLNFVVKNSKHKSFFDLVHLFRSYSHFKFGGKFFNLIEVPFLKVITKKEKEISNFTSSQLLEFFDNHPVGIFMSESDEFVSICNDSQDLDKVSSDLLDKDYYYSEVCDIKNELAVIVSNDSIYRVCNLENSLDLEPKVLDYVKNIQNHLPNGIWTMVFCNTSEGHKIKYLRIGINKWILNNLNSDELNSLINQLKI